MLLNPLKKSFEKENTHLSVHRAQQRQGLRRRCKAGQGLPTATSHPFPFSKDVFKVPISVDSLNTAQLKAGFRARQSRWAVACRLRQLVGMRAAELNGTLWNFISFRYPLSLLSEFHSLRTLLSLFEANS